MNLDKIITGLSSIRESAENLYADINEASKITQTCASIMSHAIELKNECPFIAIVEGIENIAYSADNILRLYKTRSILLDAKIRYELIPLIQEVIYDAYFFTNVFGDKDAEESHYASDYFTMTENGYAYKYDVSIIVLAYNKLEYTKKCVESILKYTPDISYELILLNNGSSDGTTDYFNSLGIEKSICLRVNSLANIKLSRRITEGRYILSVNNDVVVTENYLQNLMACMESDNSIAMVVPTTPNISNNQTIAHGYDTDEQMQLFAKGNNISDATRWEERKRLCNPIALLKAEHIHAVGEHDSYFVYGEFSDDALSHRLRSNGYRLMLAKDCYCHHYGSVTLGEAQRQSNTLEKSRALFYQRYGFDAWDLDRLT